MKVTVKHLLLVGATDGIGRALAEEYVARRWRVCVIGRNRAKLERTLKEIGAPDDRSFVAGVVCDVTEESRVRSAFEEAIRELGQLDLLIYCAGVMETDSDAEARGRAARRMFAVNAGGAAHFLELGAEYLSEVGRGQLAALGSVAGDRGRKGNPAYCASKAALETYLEGLRHRLHGSGVTVSTVKPGWVNTRMLAEKKSTAIEPCSAARQIADGLQRRREIFYVPAGWRLVGGILRWMPRFLFKRLGPA